MCYDTPQPVKSRVKLYQKPFHSLPERAEGVAVVYIKLFKLIALCSESETESTPKISRL